MTPDYTQIDAWRALAGRALPDPGPHGAHEQAWERLCRASHYLYTQGPQEGSGLLIVFLAQHVVGEASSRPPEALPDGWNLASSAPSMSLSKLQQMQADLNHPDRAHTPTSSRWLYRALVAINGTDSNLLRWPALAHAGPPGVAQLAKALLDLAPPDWLAARRAQQLQEALTYVLEDAPSASPGPSRPRF